jgi:hypothetical protein
MSGDDSTPKADGGQTGEVDQRHNGDHDDGNAIIQLAEALTRQLKAIAAGNSDQPSLNTQQVRLTTRYGALSNMLGNFGRHGTPRTGILSPSPSLVENNTKLTFARPITGAAKVVTFDAAGNLLQRLDFNASGVTVTSGNRIQTVEIEDAQGNVFLFGFVTRPLVSSQV